MIVITDPVFIKDEVNLIHQLFYDGLEILHLRKKQYTKEDIKKFIETIHNNYHKRIVLHSHYHLAEEYHLKGIHVPVTYNDKGNNKPLSISFHSVNEIMESDKKFDYGFLSPVFNSISKQNYKSNFDLQNLKNYRDLFTEKRIFALGGIDENKIDILKDTGFPGIALLGAIWQNSNPIEKFNKIKKRWMKKETVC
ncbi:MAG: hypothetical protein A2X08_08900 [Bacteroidetes bacterium GWA2_32_17]|nr:MAG: hypothetical protein A2X08_08900 [Bacteroidetes bacterium GWA2_32_17]